MIKRENLPSSLPWMPPQFEDHEIAAIRAMADGVANAGQQRLAFELIVGRLCAVGDLAFRPDDKGGERATAFASGKQWVGLQMCKLANLNITKGG